MVDVNAQIDAVARGLQTTHEEGGPSRVQTLAQVYPSVLDDVWKVYPDGTRAVIGS